MYPRSNQTRYSSLRSEEDQEKPTTRPRTSGLAACTGRQLLLALLVSVTAITAILTVHKAFFKPHAGCANPQIRKEWRTLSTSEKLSYISSVKFLQNLPSQLDTGGSRYDDFPYIHPAKGYHSHEKASFLPWHRYFLHIYERRLRTECGYNGPLPYWNWVLDHQDPAASPVFDGQLGFGGNGDASLGESEIGGGHCVTDGPFAMTVARYIDLKVHPHCLSRNFGNDTSIGHFTGKMIRPDVVEKILREDDLLDLTLKMEDAPHNAIPFGIRGDFLSFNAPADPLFFLHHAQLDRLWWKWQQEKSTRRTEYNTRISKKSQDRTSLKDLISMGDLAPDVKLFRSLIFLLAYTRVSLSCICKTPELANQLLVRQPVTIGEPCLKTAAEAYNRCIEAHAALSHAGNQTSSWKSFKSGEQREKPPSRKSCKNDMATLMARTSRFPNYDADILQNTRQIRDPKFIFRHTPQHNLSFRMSDRHQYEKIKRKSSEETDLSHVLKPTDEEQYFDEPNHITRTQTIQEHFNRHRLLASIIITSLITIFAGLAVLISRHLASPPIKETRIMNLLSLDDDTQHTFLNPPNADAILTSANTSCGNTARIARSRGCVFDVMSFNWAPPLCVDLAMQERYIAERTWEWYEDYAMTKLITPEVVQAGEYRWLFSSQKYHIAHCVYTWEKQGKFLFAEKREDEMWVDEGSFGAHHTTHCVDYILKRNVDPGQVSTIWNDVADCRAADTIGTLGK
ncbi:hypothetical protein VTL71DRAFT_9954 [Oculimacula yallundae]|uniref:Tyrosinase copper-binding domain-containing protein n=1 Tax=Oculimacula yallundae TaxID=86028 RepID=A0ABR4BR18_9HELO